MQVKPKKALGQHFLTDLGIARRIADTLDDFKDLPVVEVGPGMGVLTQFLLEKGHDLTVVEIDTESVEYLEANMPALHGHILGEDFLKLDLGALFPGRKGGYRIAELQPADPAFLAVRVAHLIDHIHRIAAVGVHRLVKAERLHYRF